MSGTIFCRHQQEMNPGLKNEVWSLVDLRLDAHSNHLPGGIGGTVISGKNEPHRGGTGLQEDGLQSRSRGPRWSVQEPSLWGLFPRGRWPLPSLGMYPTPTFVPDTKQVISVSSCLWTDRSSTMENVCYRPPTPVLSVHVLDWAASAVPFGVCVCVCAYVCTCI